MRMGATMDSKKALMNGTQSFAIQAQLGVKTVYFAFRVGFRLQARKSHQVVCGLSPRKN